MYTFYSSNILYIMFISCEICKAVHYELDRIRNPVNVDWKHGGCLIVLVSKWCAIKIKVRKKIKNIMCPLSKFFRGNSDPFIC